jgi:hypothetical protein
MKPHGWGTRRLPAFLEAIGSGDAKPNMRHEVTAPRAVGPSGRTLIEFPGYFRSMLLQLIHWPFIYERVAMAVLVSVAAIHCQSYWTSRRYTLSK